MKKFIIAIAVIFTVALVSCQNATTETQVTPQDTVQVDTTSAAIDTTTTAADSIAK